MMRWRSPVGNAGHQIGVRSLAIPDTAGAGWEGVGEVA
jgi:hypothetical protein